MEKRAYDRRMKRGRGLVECLDGEVMGRGGRGKWCLDRENIRKVFRLRGHGKIIR